MNSGVYQQDDTDLGPEGALVFLGAMLKAEQSPTKWVDENSSSRPAATVSRSTGSRPAKAAARPCAPTSRRPEGRDLRLGDQGLDRRGRADLRATPDKVAKLMLDVREDVE